jgi:hypothetical protein
MGEMLVLLAQCVSGTVCDDTPGPPFLMAILPVLAVVLLFALVVLLIARVTGLVESMRTKRRRRSLRSE